MSDSKTVILNLRVTPAVMAALEARAASERRPVRSMGAILLEDALTRQGLAHSAPLMSARVARQTDVVPRFKKSGKER